jgi:DNA polymerase III delta prime subunit
MDKHISNIGKLVSMILATRSIDYFKVPSTMMGLTQMAYEELWCKLSSGELSNSTSSILNFLPNSSNYDFTSFTNFTSFGEFNGFASYTSSNTSKLLDLFYESYIFWLSIIFLFFYVTYYFINKIFPIYSFFTNSYYYCLLKSNFNKKFIRNHSSKIVNHNDMSLIIDHLTKPNDNKFLLDYCMNRLYRHKYDSLPQNAYSSQLDVYKTLPIPDSNVIHYFKDDTLGVRGYITWHEETINISINSTESERNKDGTVEKVYKNDLKETVVPVMFISVNCHVNEYIDKIKAHCRDKILKRELYYTQMNGASTPYSKLIDRLEFRSDWRTYFQRHYLSKMEKNWIDTLFHPSKLDIWPKLKAIQFDSDIFERCGQYSQGCWCLYGPPGTGKSTSIYRYAKSLGRNIVYVNLIGIKSINDLRKIINGTGSSGYSSTDPNESIIVFDEFDRSMLAIHARTKLKNQQEMERRVKIQRVLELLDRNEKRDEEIDMHETHETHETHEGDTPKQSKHEKGAVDEQEMKSDIKNFTEMNDEEITIDGLLDVIQGCSENRGSIIFAITNKYDKLRELAPRLFRDGRFKPIYYGYPTKQIVNDITQYYYQRSVCDIPELAELSDDQPIRISTARLTNRAVDTIIRYPDDTEKQYESFIQHLMYDMKNHKLADKFTEYEECIDTDMAI